MEMEIQNLRHFYQKEKQFMAATSYSGDERAKNLRQAAVLLIEKIWTREKQGDALIPYIAMNYYDRLFTSRDSIPTVISKSGEKENRLFVVCCLTIALKLRTDSFTLSTFLERHRLRYDNEQVKRMEIRICSGLKWRMDTLTPICFMKYFIQKFLKYSHSVQRMQQTHRLVYQLIVKSQADIAITAFRPSVVAASALLAISSKLILGQYDELETLLFDDEFIRDNTAFVQECTPKIDKWTDGLDCHPVAIPETNIENDAKNEPDNDEVHDDDEIKEQNDETTDSDISYCNLDHHGDSVDETFSTNITPLMNLFRRRNDESVSFDLGWTAVVGSVENLGLADANSNINLFQKLTCNCFGHFIIRGLSNRGDIL